MFLLTCAHSFDFAHGKKVAAEERSEEFAEFVNGKDDFGLARFGLTTTLAGSTEPESEEGARLPGGVDEQFHIHPNAGRVVDLDHPKRNRASGFQVEIKHIAPESRDEAQFFSQRRGGGLARTGERG